ncbi:MAG: cobalt ABC transporter [Propionibacteriaceae bacterium]
MISLTELLADALRSAARPVVLIDGGAGAGKSSLGIALASAWGPDVQLVSMDAFYPGWDGLAAGSRIVAEDVLDDREPHFDRWLWASETVGERVDLDPNRPLIVEGCGSLTPASRARASYGVWCELDTDSRKQRALARDGAVFAREWDRWASEEAQHWTTHRPWELADTIWRAT